MKNLTFTEFNLDGKMKGNFWRGITALHNGVDMFKIHYQPGTQFRKEMYWISDAFFPRTVLKGMKRMPKFGKYLHKEFSKKEIVKQKCQEMFNDYVKFLTD